jgi:hypothetical protein
MSSLRHSQKHFIFLNIGGGPIKWLLLEKTRGVSHYGLAKYIIKYLKAKKQNCENSNISPCKNI